MEFIPIGRCEFYFIICFIVFGITPLTLQVKPVAQVNVVAPDVFAIFLIGLEVHPGDKPD